MFDRIVSDPAILSGKPCIKGTRLSVEFLLELVASGGTIPQIVAKYPQLTPADVEQAVRFAAHALKNDVLITARLAG
jgi:uncharacterized protein (DUF433 family)